jgi:signal transduction histidine kinase
MADKLQRFEGQVRSTERQRTFNQLGRAIAHEIRNAVTGSQMAIDLHRRALQKTDSGSRIETRHLDVAKKQMRSMDRAIGRFLRMGDATTATAEKVDFSGVIANVTELISPLAEHLDVKLEVNQPAEPIFAIGHPGDIEQAVINLAINAIQAAASVQTGEAKHVSIDLSNLDGQIKIKVSDSGPGPADEIAGKIFEPFESGKPDGLGLGLPLSQQIAEAHSGTIKWWREDRQTVFELTLPAANG